MSSAHTCWHLSLRPPGTPCLPLPPKPLLASSVTAASPMSPPTCFPLLQNPTLGPTNWFTQRKEKAGPERGCDLLGSHSGSEGHGGPRTWTQNLFCMRRAAQHLSPGCAFLLQLPNWVASSRVSPEGCGDVAGCPGLCRTMNRLSQESHGGPGPSFLLTYQRHIWHPPRPIPPSMAWALEVAPPADPALQRGAIGGIGSRHRASGHRATPRPRRHSNSRSILVAPVEHQEGVRLSEKVLLVQLVGTELHGGHVLAEKGGERTCEVGGTGAAGTPGSLRPQAAP